MLLISSDVLTSLFCLRRPPPSLHYMSLHRHRHKHSVPAGLVVSRVPNKTKTIKSNDLGSRLDATSKKENGEEEGEHRPRRLCWICPLWDCSCLMILLKEMWKLINLDVFIIFHDVSWYLTDIIDKKILFLLKWPRICIWYANTCEPQLSITSYTCGVCQQ